MKGPSRFLVVLLLACLACSESASAMGYLGVKTGAGTGVIGAELEFPVWGNLSVLVQGGVAASEGASVVGGGVGLRGYASSGALRPFVTGYVGSAAISYFSWYTGSESLTVSYYGGTVGAKYERHGWYATAEVGYGYFPSLAVGGPMLGCSLGLTL